MTIESFEQPSLMTIEYPERSSLVSIQNIERPNLVTIFFFDCFCHYSKCWRPQIRFKLKDPEFCAAHCVAILSCVMIRSPRNTLHCKKPDSKIDIGHQTIVFLNGPILASFRLFSSFPHDTNQCELIKS